MTYRVLYAIADVEDKNAVAVLHQLLDVLRKQRLDVAVGALDLSFELAEALLPVSTGIIHADKQDCSGQADSDWFAHQEFFVTWK